MSYRIGHHRHCHLLLLRGCAMVAFALAAGRSGWSQQSVADTAAFHGFSQPWELIEVAVAESGRVDQVTVREGDRVKPNSLIARLDDTVLQATLEVARQRASARGAEASARARLNHAARRRDDIARLLEESHASQTELDQAELAVREAETAVLAEQERRDIALAEVEKIRAELSRREIRSPIEGVVIELNRRRGEYAGGADPVIAKVAVLDKLRLRINVPTPVALAVSVAERIDIEFPEAALKAEGTIDFISPITDSQSGTVRIDILLDNQRGQLRGGLLGVWRCRLPTGPPPTGPSDHPSQANRQTERAIQ